MFLFRASSAGRRFADLDDQKTTHSGKTTRNYHSLRGWWPWHGLLRVTLLCIICTWRESFKYGLWELKMTCTFKDLSEAYVVRNEPSLLAGRCAARQPHRVGAWKDSRPSSVQNTGRKVLAIQRSGAKAPFCIFGAKFTALPCRCHEEFTKLSMSTRQGYPGPSDLRVYHTSVTDGVVQNIKQVRILCTRVHR